MALVLTKKVTTAWDGPISVDPAFITARDNFINQLIAEGKTDGQWWAGNEDSTTGYRHFIDIESAQEFVRGIVEISAPTNRVLLSSSITDI
jgi:hypothetical protein